MLNLFMKNLMEKLTWGNIILICLTLGLAPFNPPHVLEKIEMLINGELIRAIDWIDLIMHGTPWLLPFIKMGYGKRVSGKA